MLQKESYPSTKLQRWSFYSVNFPIALLALRSSKQALEKKQLLSEDNLSSTVIERTQIELKCSN